MANETIKQAAKKSGVRLWRVAEAIGVADVTLSRRLRHELPEAQRNEILCVIERLAAEVTE